MQGLQHGPRLPDVGLERFHAPVPGERIGPASCVTHDAMSASSVHVEHRPDDHRFVADVAGGEAVLVYQRLADGELDLQHTIVPEEARGGGVGDALVRAAVDYARRDGVTLIPTCPYVAAWLARHPKERAVFSDDE